MREHATAVNGQVASTDAADVLDVRSFFGLTEKAARSAIADVAHGVSESRSMATSAGIDRQEQDQVAVALSSLPSVAAL
jgi:hypothetical protein